MSKFVLCDNCKKNEGTIQWVGEGSVLDAVHGFYVMWCEICCLEAQIKHAKERADEIPNMEKELIALRKKMEKNGTKRAS